MSSAPLPTEELQQIAAEACETVLANHEAYDHGNVNEWNTSIINTILQNLINKTTTAENTQPQFKYIVNSTLIQHIGNPKEPEKHGRRGMHSAVGAFWNAEKDGTFNYKWEAAEKKGMDIVVVITWIAI